MYVCIHIFFHTTRENQNRVRSTSPEFAVTALYYFRFRFLVNHVLSLSGWKTFINSQNVTIGK